ncbi:MAG: hypothetical protein J6C53_01020 [Clostridia bacterium]|nr:hypothetical protein [Clostridia bacterium]
MLKKILPNDIYNILTTRVNINSVNEIRIRADKPIVLLIGIQRVFLGSSGITANIKEAIFASKIMVEDVIFRASECSIYSVNEQIKRGFLVMKGGIRLGIGGDMIEDSGKIKTMTNFTSVNIRIPHEIKNCSLSAFNYLLNEKGVQNTLVISPPGGGKTTFLRDFVKQLSLRNYAYNVLVLDERGELDIGVDGCIGNFADKICYSNKTVGFENGIRALSPNIIVTDELGQNEDVDAILYAVNCGVSIMASVHSDTIENLQQKPYFEKLLAGKVFKRFVLLSTRNGPGTLEGIYDENFARVKI